MKLFFGCSAGAPRVSECGLDEHLGGGLKLKGSNGLRLGWA